MIMIDLGVEKQGKTKQNESGGKKTILSARHAQRDRSHGHVRNNTIYTIALIASIYPCWLAAKSCSKHMCFASQGASSLEVHHDHLKLLCVCP